MFEHLDDPIEFQPPEALHQNVRARGRQIRRRRWTLAAGSGLATLLLGLVIAGGALQWRVDQIDRVDIQTAPAAVDEPPGVEFVVLVGTDETGRADTIAVARIDRTHDTLSVLSIPRDYVPAGTTRRMADLLLDGRQEFVDAVWPGADHYIELDFDGFRSIVNQVGGVALDVGQPLRDTGTGLDLAPGCQVLDGESALAFARSRHVEVLGEDGVWQADSSGDLGRVERSHLLLASLAAAAQSTDLSPAKLNDFLTVMVDHATIDSNWGTDDLASLGWWLSRLGLGAATFKTLPTESGTVETNSVLVPGPFTKDTLDTFAHGEPSQALESGVAPTVELTAPTTGRCN